MKIDLRNIKNNETILNNGWLITRVCGGWIYREMSPESTAMVFIPMKSEIEGFGWEIEIENQ